MPRLPALVHQRLREDFRFGVYLAFAGAALLLLFPLAFVRFAQGLPANGILNLALSAVIVGAMAYGLRGGDLDRLGRVAAILITGGAAVAVVVGDTGLYWAFPTVLAASFLAPPLLATLLAAALVGVLLVEGDSLAASGQPLALLLSLVGNAVFGLLFAQRSALKRAELERLARNDPLTGVGNRRALEHEMAVAAATFHRDGRPVALCLVDLDHFKRINDAEGHEVGDRVLAAFATLVAGTMRQTDRLFRYGGEEFVMLLPVTDTLGAGLVLEKLRRTLRTTRLEGRHVVTASVGVAVLRHGEPVEAWLARADAALYRAKALGRDRVEIDPEPGLG